MKQSLFITATDTDIGKTITTLSIGLLLQKQGFDVGVFKPIQCSGDDAAFLKNRLSINDPLELINPYYAPEPLSPHIAFQRINKTINIKRIRSAYEEIKSRHDIVLIEGAGGLMVPIKKGYLVADLILDLETEAAIVSRLGLGTINHTLLTIKQAQYMGIKLRGVIFNQSLHERKSIAHKTNPDAIKEYSKTTVLGEIPYLKSLENKSIVRIVSKSLNVDKMFKQKRDTKTRQLEKWDKDYIWHPFTQMQDWLKQEPLVVDQARGSYLIDSNGNKYLDGVSSLWVNVHGHRKQAIDQSIKDQINKLSHSTLLGLSNTPAIELAKKLIDITPKGLDKVFYSDNGSTSVEVAIKMAYQYWQNIGRSKKTGIVHLANSYHGDTLGSVSVGGIDLFHKVYRDLIFKTIKLEFPDGYRAPKGQTYPKYAFDCLEDFETLLKKDHEKIAAMVVEPIVQGAAGIIIWPKGILKRMSELCKKYDVIFITDEVATGFGRTGTMFACEQENVVPDIMCLAKGITGGYLPLAATVTSNRVYEGFLHQYEDQKAFFHGHTYTGNPLCCAAALANLKVFEEERVLTKMAPKIKYLRNALQMFYNLESVGDVRQLGFMIGIELVQDKLTKKPYSWKQEVGVKVCQKARMRGVVIRPLGNVIVLMPPLSISNEEIKVLVNVTYECIKEITE